jgi:hypothetical protein
MKPHTLLDSPHPAPDGSIMETVKQIMRWALLSAVAWAYIFIAATLMAFAVLLVLILIRTIGGFPL